MMVKHISGTIADEGHFMHFLFSQSVPPAISNQGGSSDADAQLRMYMPLMRHEIQ